MRSQPFFTFGSSCKHLNAIQWYTPQLHWLELSSVLSVRCFDLASWSHRESFRSYILSVAGRFIVGGRWERGRGDGGNRGFKWRRLWKRRQKIRWGRGSKEEDELKGKLLDWMMTDHDKDLFLTWSKGLKKTFLWWEKTLRSYTKPHQKSNVL